MVNDPRFTRKKVVEKFPLLDGFELDNMRNRSSPRYILAGKTIEFHDVQISGIISALKHLIPSVDIDYSVLSQNRASQKFDFIRQHKEQLCGDFIRPEKAFLFFMLADKRLCVLILTRKLFEFSTNERIILKTFTDAIKPLIIPESERGVEASLRLASRYTFENLLITRFLRGYTGSGTFWTQASIISQLQDLTFCKYEGAKCTSGFIFLSDIKAYLKEFKKFSNEFEFIKFNNPILDN